MLEFNLSEIAGNHDTEKLGIFLYRKHTRDLEKLKSIYLLFMPSQPKFAGFAMISYLSYTGNWDKLYPCEEENAKWCGGIGYLPYVLSEMILSFVKEEL